MEEIKKNAPSAPKIKINPRVTVKNVPDDLLKGVKNTVVPEVEEPEIDSPVEEVP